MDAQKRIKQLMEERGWTDYRLAKEANLSHSTITNVFKRNNAPTLPTLEVICRAFGITLAQFFAEGGEAVEITDEQRELFAKWSTLTEKQKALLLEFIAPYSRGQRKRPQAGTCGFLFALFHYTAQRNSGPPVFRERVALHALNGNPLLFELSF